MLCSLFHNKHRIQNQLLWGVANFKITSIYCELLSITNCLLTIKIRSRLSSSTNNYASWASATDTHMKLIWIMAELLVLTITGHRKVGFFHSCALVPHKMYKFWPPSFQIAMKLLNSHPPLVKLGKDIFQQILDFINNHQTLPMIFWDLWSSP